MSDPVIDSLGDLESLPLAAKRYEMAPIIDTHKRSIENPVFNSGDPLRLDVIA